MDKSFGISNAEPEKILYLLSNTAITPMGVSRRMTSNMDSLLYSALTDVFSEPSICAFFKRFQLEILKIKYDGIFANASIIWRLPVSAKNEPTATEFDVISQHISHELQARRLISKPVAIKFVRDAPSSNGAIVEKLLQTADVGSLSTSDNLVMESKPQSVEDDSQKAKKHPSKLRDSINARFSTLLSSVELPTSPTAHTGRLPRSDQKKH